MAKVKITDLSKDEKNMIRDSQIRRLKNNPNLENISPDRNGNRNGNGNIRNRIKNGNPTSPYSLGLINNKRIRDENNNNDNFNNNYDNKYGSEEDDDDVIESQKDGDESRYGLVD